MKNRFGRCATAHFTISKGGFSTGSILSRLSQPATAFRLNFQHRGILRAIHQLTMATLSDLKQDHKNARKRTETSASLLKESLQRYGPARSIVIDEDDRILAGNGTVDLAEWDAEMLQQLSAEHDISPWFDDDDVEALLEQVEQLDPVEGKTDPDEVPEPPVEPTTKPGDLWILGNHRLLCGDSTNPQHVERLMDGVTPEMVYTDPPYGISIVKGGTVNGSKPFGSVGGSNIVKVGNYAPVAGDDSIDVALDAIELIKTLGAKTQIIWGGNYYANALPNSSCWIVWDKENTGNFADAELAWTNQETAVRIFKHMWNGMLKASERGQKRVHPTQKPVALAEWCFENYGRPKTVLDLFLGSGSTLIACEQTHRSCYGMELSPAYCDVIVKRWEDFTGNTAVCIPSETHFDDAEDDI